MTKVSNVGRSASAVHSPSHPASHIAQKDCTKRFFVLVKVGWDAKGPTMSVGILSVRFHLMIWPGPGIIHPVTYPFFLFEEWKTATVWSRGDHALFILVYSQVFLLQKLCWKSLAVLLCLRRITKAFTSSNSMASCNCIPIFYETMNVSFYGTI